MICLSWLTVTSSLFTSRVGLDIRWTAPNTHTHTHCRYAFWINKMSNNIYVIILFVNDKRRDWEEWGLWLLGICKIWQIHILNECDVCRWRYTCAPVRISMCSLYTEKQKKKEKKRTRHVVTTYLFQVNGIKKIINFIFILNFFVGKILLFYFKSTDFRLYFVFTMHFCRFFR